MRGTSVRPAFAALLAILALAAFACGGGGGGLRLVFYSGRDGDDDIYIMNADGSAVRQLTNEPGRDYEADSSDDGRTLVFVSDRAGEEGDQLYLMDVDGSDVRRLTFSAGAGGARVVDDYPHWSPDGRTIVFQRTTIPAQGDPDADIWLIDVESGEETQLTDTPDAWDSTPSFSADGKSILFESDRDGDYDIYRLDRSTKAIVQLTNEKGTDLEAKESPHGRQISFASARTGGFDIYVMNSDGSDVRRLTDSEAVDRCAHWSPDGTRLSFYSERDGDREIYVMDTGGGGIQRLTNSPGNDEVPNWVESP